MFNLFGKKEEKKVTKDDKKKSLTFETSNTVVSSTSHRTETRRVTHTSESSSYSSTKTGISVQRSTPDLSSDSLSKLPPGNPIRSLSVLEYDATLFAPPSRQALNAPVLTTNYRSPFSRQLVPYNSARSPSASSNAQAIARPSIQYTQNNTVPSIIPTYNTSGNKRGNVLIINNIKFMDNNEERKGAELDEKAISKLFKDMGFDVSSYKNLKVSEMRDRVKKFSKDKSLAKGDISVVIMMSHGNNKINDKIVPGSFTQIFGADGQSMGIEEVLDEFSGKNCTGMLGKPKIFIFQCCRGDRSELQVDAAPIRNITKMHADMLIAFSTLPGFYSLRDPRQGSWYIQSICDVFGRYAKDFDVEALLKIVDDQLSKKHPTYKQTSTYESRGFKQCFLNPRR